MLGKEPVNTVSLGWDAICAFSKRFKTPGQKRRLRGLAENLGERRAACLAAADRRRVPSSQRQVNRPHSTGYSERRANERHDASAKDKRRLRAHDEVEIKSR